MCYCISLSAALQVMMHLLTVQTSPLLCWVFSWMQTAISCDIPIAFFWPGKIPSSNPSKKLLCLGDESEDCRDPKCKDALNCDRLLLRQFNSGSISQICLLDDEQKLRIAWKTVDVPFMTAHEISAAGQGSHLQCRFCKGLHAHKPLLSHQRLNDLSAPL